MEYPYPPDELVEHLKAGTYDGHWVKILKAYTFRQNVGQLGIQWHCSLFGLDIPEGKLKLSEARRLEGLLQTTWQKLAPAASAETCHTILSVLLQSRQGLSEQEASDKADELTMDEIVDGFQPVERERPPFDTPTSTTT
jgi:hypothetical protein